MTHPLRFLRALALAVPFLLAVGCSDDENGGPSSTVLVDAVLAGNGGIIVVTDGAAAVTGADVTLNGTAATAGATDGEYTVALAPPVAAGGALTLDVTDGVAIVQGTGTVPEAPVFTAPLDGADVPVGADVEVTWTSTANPDGWALVATSGGSTVTVETADGALRTLNIGGASLAAGDWEVNLYAVNDGLLTGDTEPGSTMAIRSAAAANPTISVVPPVLVTGSAMGPEANSIEISQGGATLNGATVTVNGEAALQGAPGDEYFVQLAAPVAVGGALDLDIAFGGVVIQGSGTVPEAPVVTAPADGAAIPVGNPVNVTWTATTDPSRWVVVVTDGDAFHEMEVAGTARAASFAAGTILVGGPYVVRVFSRNDGTFTGPVAAESRMNITNENAVQPDFTVTP
jgi:hypothetical protein